MLAIRTITTVILAKNNSNDNSNKSCQRKHFFPSCVSLAPKVHFGSYSKDLGVQPDGKSTKSVRSSKILEECCQPFLPFFFFLSLFIFERDRDSASVGGAEREGERDSQAGSMLPAQSVMCSRNHETI